MSDCSSAKSFAPVVVVSHGRKIYINTLEAIPIVFNTLGIAAASPSPVHSVCSSDMRQFPEMFDISSDHRVPDRASSARAPLSEKKTVADSFMQAIDQVVSIGEAEKVACLQVKAMQEQLLQKVATRYAESDETIRRLNARCEELTMKIAKYEDVSTLRPTCSLPVMWVLLLRPVSHAGLMVHPMTRVRFRLKLMYIMLVVEVLLLQARLLRPKDERRSDEAVR
eukprot:TRINITY_DN5911_c0_g3_i1.p1 TRINITY_DN5911_c0_g3~~TRINITY_DN5911_c0_g3_i1.p1  ORF type:complete len:224 (-),score=31.25 TRINITY_DN5911_c0_g3_i1:684-1355(-)